MFGEETGAACLDLDVDAGAQVLGQLFFEDFRD